MKAVDKKPPRGIATRMAKRANPVTLKLAGKYFRSLSILKHVGRRSGREYATPVAAFPLGDGFVFALLYGDLTQVDWCRNVMSAGQCTLKTLKIEYRLERPEIIAASKALGAYPLYWKFLLRLRGIKQFLWVHQQSEAPAKVTG
jgi:hypothetical protein